MKSKISVISPVYNEEKSLEPLAKGLVYILEKINRDYEIIFINDGSTDKSGQVLKKIAKKNKKFKIINFKRNFGQTAAIAAGIKNSEGEIIVLIDSDLENDPADIKKLIAELNKGYDIVSGWRRDRWKDKFFTRRLTSQVANLMISKVSGVKLHDYGCTLKAYNRGVLANVKLYGEMHRFIPVIASWQGARITEIPVNYRPRQFGKSNYNLTRIFKVLLDLVIIKFLSDYSSKPIYFFGRLGFMSAFLGILAGLWAVYYKIAGEKDFISTPLPTIMVLFLILGALMILIGLLAEIMMRVYYESQDRETYYIENKINF